MSYDNASLVRQLIPVSFSFDAYNKINYPNSRDKPFFSDNVLHFDEEQYLTIQLVSRDKISLTFSSVCEHGEITFPHYYLSLGEFVTKLQDAVKSGRDFIPLEITVNRRSHYSHYSCHRACDANNEYCQALRQNNPEKVYAAVSFKFNEMKEALASYFEITNMQTSKGGKNNMKRNNKFFGLNFEFGVSKDHNIASTLMGLAVKNPQNNNWYVFDPATNTRKNIANLKFGNFPVMLLPTREYVVGHLYKEYGQYYYVQSVNADKTVTLVSAADGIIRQQIPEQGIIPGFDFHTEVIAFDAQNLMNGNSKESVGGNLLAAMLMMNWSKGNGAEFSLESINDDSFNGLGQYLPLLLMNQNGGLGNMFTNDPNSNLMMMMALGSGEGEGNDMMQMMVLSQLLGGGNNPFAGVLPTAATPAAPAADNKVACEKCGVTYPEGTNFCPKCGGKTKAVAKTCRVCGATLMDDAAFCHKCGAKTHPDVCPNCGQPKADDACFCPKCGTALNVPAPVAPAEVPAPTVEAPKTEA